MRPATHRSGHILSRRTVLRGAGVLMALPFFESLRVLGIQPHDCLLVGDAPADMEAGRRAGVRTCAVRWGYGDPDEMARWQPDYWIDAPEQLTPAGTNNHAIP